MKKVLKSILIIICVLVTFAPVSNITFAQPIEVPGPDEVREGPTSGMGGQRKAGWTLVPPECLGPDAADVYPIKERDANGNQTGSIMTNPAGKQDGDPVCGFPEFMKLIANAIGLLLVIALSLSTLLFSIAGFRYVTAAGNTSQVEGAKKMFLNVAIGLAIVFGAYLLVQVVVSTLGVEDDYNQFLEPMN